MPEPHGAIMSGEFDSGKYLHSIKFEQRPQILLNLSFRELCDSKLSGLCPLNNNGHFIELKIRQNKKLWL